MKQIFITFISLTVLFCQLSCSSSSFVSYDENIENITVTTNESYVRSMTKLGYITIKYKIPLFGSMYESEMRQGALLKLKKKAQKIGAKIVLIQEENFNPFNPEYMIRGIAYK